MTLPDTPFVCKNIDVGAMNDAIDRQASSLEIVEALLGEVIPAEVETDSQIGELPRPDNGYRRYVGPWQPVVSDKE
jgi:hypothetical protein